MAANAGRRDYDATVRMPFLHPGEPFLVIRGQDELAADAARAYAALAWKAGVDRALVESALQRADALAAWSPRKLPDLDHLTEDERLQLRYQLTRRAWRAREGVDDAVALLAEQRAYDALLARLRPVLRALFDGSKARADGSWVWRPPAGVAGAIDPLQALTNLPGLLAAPPARAA